MNISKVKCLFVSVGIACVTMTVPVSQVWADDTGAKDPTTSVSVFPPSGGAWLNPSGVISTDDQYANRILDDNQNTQYLFVRGFDFSAIPDDATIDGIEVAIERSYQCAANFDCEDGGQPDKGEIREGNIRLIKGGVPNTANRATTTPWPNADTVANYGSASDLWGQSFWTPAQIKGNFGVAISAYYFGNGDPRIARIDHVTIKVYYTPHSSTGKVNTT
jgi:hypothetical protein